MKKSTSVLSVILVVLCVLFFQSGGTYAESTAEVLTEGDYTYVIKEDQTVEITGYTGSESELLIPKTLNGLPVTSIGFEAFAYNENLIKVTVPESITKIGERAFALCALQEVILSEGLTEIGYCAFFNSSDIAIMKLPESLVTIGSGAFFNIDVTEFYISKNVIEIGNNPFEACDNAVITVSPDNTGYAVVSGSLVNLTSKTLICHMASLKDERYEVPSDIVEIGVWAFGYNRYLTEVILPDGVERIGSAAFEYCTNLTRVKIPDSVKAIGSCCFGGCSSLQVVEAPLSYQHLGQNIFGGCSALTEVPEFFQAEAVQKQAAEAKQPDIAPVQTNEPEVEADASASVTDGQMPDNEEQVSQDSDFTYIEAYYNWPVTNAEITGYTGEATVLNVPEVLDGYPVTAIRSWAFRDNKRIRKVLIHQGIIRIDSSAFDNCENLTEVILPAGLEEIGSYAFCYANRMGKP